MKKTSYSLSGEWKLCWQDTGKGTIDQKNKLWETAISCQVPGDVHIALTEAGIIKEPLLDVNSMECRWMEEKEFWYKKVFYIEKDFLQEYTEIEFEGLDLTADIWLNGHYIGSHNNAFIEKVIDISETIQAGENTLIVRIDDGVYGVKDKPLELMEHSWNSEQPYRAWMRKPQFVYGWDWTIWMPTCGIWKNVTIHSYDAGIIRDCHMQTSFSDAEVVKAEYVNLEASVELDFLQSGDYILTCEVYGDERYENEAEAKIICNKELHVDIQKNTKLYESLDMVIHHPQLWWPNGAGKQYLYTIKLYLTDSLGHVVQEICKKHGLRTVSLREEALDETSKSFTFMINGEPIFAKGANHVPADCFPGRITDEKNRKLLTMAAEANMNMIRVWGGGIYESDGFMEACDELGLMVWHDFMFACAYYPDHVPEFYEEIRREATAAIKRLRGHASLVGWSGNNEIQEMYLSAKNSGKDFPWYGGRLYEELLPSLVKELCPDRIYRESSPFGGEEPTSYDMGDQHTWHFTHRPQWEHYLDLWRFTDFDFKFLSEFGVIGAMNLESARKCISEDKLYRNSEEWKHHTNTSSEHRLLDIFVEKYFGLQDDIGLQEFILKSQVLQAEIMRHIYDELRSRKFRCSGALFWTLSDSYGVHNWSVIDYYLAKRPLYYYMKRSLAPVNVAFRGYEAQTFDGMTGYGEYYKDKPEPVEILVMNDALDEKQIILKYQLMTFDGRVIMEGAKEQVVAANAVEKLVLVDLSDVKAQLVPEETILYTQVIENGQVINENRYFLAPYKTLDLKEACVECKMEQMSDTMCELVLSADTFVWMLHLATPVGVEATDNDFDLIPGQKKKITVQCEKMASYVPELHSLNPGIKINLVK